jgi:hypothetical protein
MLLRHQNDRSLGGIIHNDRASAMSAGLRLNANFVLREIELGGGWRSRFLQIDHVGGKLGLRQRETGGEQKSEKAGNASDASKHVILLKSFAPQLGAYRALRSKAREE